MTRFYSLYLLISVLIDHKTAYGISRNLDGELAKEIKKMSLGLHHKPVIGGVTNSDAEVKLLTSFNQVPKTSLRGKVEPPQIIAMPLLAGVIGIAVGDTIFRIASFFGGLELGPGLIDSIQVSHYSGGILIGSELALSLLKLQFNGGYQVSRLDLRGAYLSQDLNSQTTYGFTNRSVSFVVGSRNLSYWGGVFLDWQDSHVNLMLNRGGQTFSSLRNGLFSKRLLLGVDIGNVQIAFGQQIGLEESIWRGEIGIRVAQF